MEPPKTEGETEHHPEDYELPLWMQSGPRNLNSRRTRPISGDDFRRMMDGELDGPSISGVWRSAGSASVSPAAAQATPETRPVIRMQRVSITDSQHRKRRKLLVAEPRVHSLMVEGRVMTRTAKADAPLPSNHWKSCRANSLSPPLQRRKVVEEKGVQDEGTESQLSSDESRRPPRHRLWTSPRHVSSFKAPPALVCSPSPPKAPTMTSTLGRSP